MSDTQIRESLIQNLVKNGMPPDLAPRAADCWTHLLASSGALESLITVNGLVGIWAQYAFMQGFVAGAVSSAHHN